MKGTAHETVPDLVRIKADFTQKRTVVMGGQYTLLYTDQDNQPAHASYFGQK